jgi:catechol 2,3-dioxygenase-like lactoylglutathione lyase family enzyme
MSSSIVTGFGVHLKVASISASRAFYEDYLGLTPVFAYGDEQFVKSFPSDVTTVSEDYSGVTYEIPGGAKIEIADGHIAVKDADVFSSPIVSPKVSAMINVTSLVPLLDKSAIRPKSTVKKYYWGSIEMVLRDPDGWVVVLIAPFSEAELAAVRERVDVDIVEPRS